MCNEVRKRIGLILTLVFCVLTCSSFDSSHLFDSRKAKSLTLWQALRADFRLPDTSQQPQVQHQLRWLARHRTFLREMINDSIPYLYYIHQQVKKRGMPAELALMPMIESTYDPFAYQTHSGAAGLWQLMPGTGSGLGLKQDWWYDGRRDIYASTKAALDYLTYLNNFFSGNWLLAIAAYNSGEGTVMHAIKRNARRSLPTKFWMLPLPHETRAYVPRLLALATIIRDPKRYGLKLPAIANRPYFAPVHVGFQLDLTAAAKMAHIPLTELYKLNPGYNRWATDPNGPFTIVLPLDKINLFKHNLAKLPRQHRVSWARHIVKPGDNLSTIAKHYKTKIHLIRTLNRLDDKPLQPGQALLIPKAPGNSKRQRFNQRQHHAMIAHPHAGPRKVIYEVTRQDTLGRIAKHYHIKPAHIQYWNHLAYHEYLKPGRKLILWIKPRKVKFAKTHYRVKSGDTLLGIAHHFHVSLKALKRWNQLKDVNKLRLGQRLLLYRRV